MFNEDDSLLCALDRIFDDATVFNIRGESYRNKELENIALQTGKASVNASDEQSAHPEPLVIFVRFFTVAIFTRP